MAQRDYTRKNDEPSKGSIDVAERRFHSRRADDTGIEILSREMREDRVEARAHRMKIQGEISCLASNFKQFKSDWDATYKPHLDTAIESKRETDEFIREKLKSWKSRAADAVVAGVGLAIVYAVVAADVLQKVWARAKSIL